MDMKRKCHLTDEELKLLRFKANLGVDGGDEKCGVMIGDNMHNFCVLPRGHSGDHADSCGFYIDDGHGCCGKSSVRYHWEGDDNSICYAVLSRPDSSGSQS